MKFPQPQNMKDGRLFCETDISRWVHALYLYGPHIVIKFCFT
ncbi:hypothetical protein LINGRAHAP2_LOCUS20213 [Linum grandiflorum]